jgi:hypothetical protein
MALQDQVPAVERNPWGILCLILNIVPWAGIGSIIAGAKASHTKTIVFGIIQFVTAVILIGWIWSIVWGVLIFMKSTVTAPAANAHRSA